MKHIFLLIAMLFYVQTDCSSHFSNVNSTLIYSHSNKPKAVKRVAGTLDATFGSAGVVSKNLSGTTENAANDIAIDRFGRIVVAGQTTLGSEQRFTLARFMPDGSLDTNFGSGGYVNADISTSTSYNNYANAIAIDSQNRIVVAGVYNSDPAIVRYLENGSIDTTFGTAGLTATSISNSNYIEDIAFDSTGRIIALGYSTSNANDILVLCYNKDGGLDTTFGSSGYTILSAETTAETAFGLAIDSSDNIIVGGAQDGDLLIAKLTSAGELDTTFGVSGVVLLSTTNPVEALYSVKIDNQNRIVASGVSNDETTSPNAYGFFIARLLSTGDLDTTFNSVGYGVYSADGFTTTDKGTLAIDPLGRLLVMGSQNYTGTDSGYKFFVMRILPTGAVDTDFGTNDATGSSYISTAGNFYAHIGVLDLQGRVVMAGYTSNNFYLARFTSDYTFDYYKNQFAGTSLGLLD